MQERRGERGVEERVLEGESKRGAGGSYRERSGGMEVSEVDGYAAGRDVTVGRRRGERGTEEREGADARSGTVWELMDPSSHKRQCNSSRGVGGGEGDNLRVLRDVTLRT